MATILDDIITKKKKEVELLLDQTFEQASSPYTGPTLAEIVRKKNTMAMIAEIKRASPSKGVIRDTVNPARQALMYEKNGASAISVLTDTPFFKGTMDDLRQVREAVNLPILCKDFIIDTIQIDQAKAAGANIILLIAAALHDEKMKELYDYAVALDLEVLCEVHHEAEMERVLRLAPTLIGINNRNLKTFEVDLTTTNRLANMVVDPNTILIGESGIRTKAEVEQLAEAGAEIILIGETLMRADNLTETMRQLQVPLPNKVRVNNES